MQISFGAHPFRSLLALVALTTMGDALRGQSTANSSTDSVTIRQLQARIAELEAVQKQILERLGKVAPAAVEAPAPVLAPAPAVVPETPAEAPVEASEPTPGHAYVLGPLQFSGFSDFTFGRPWFENLPDNTLKGTTNSFGLGDFDLVVNSRLSEHWNVLGEMLITSDATNEFSAEMERLQLTYKMNDYLKISFGKFTTALGYYTTEFHRAQYFQTGFGRPFMYADEDQNGILPTHSIGVSATGLIPHNPLGLHWVAEASNGRSSLFPQTPVQNFNDDNNGKALNFALYARPEKWEGFQAGLSVYRDVLYPAGQPKVGQTIYTGHIVYVGRRLEWLNEASLIRHAVNGGGVFKDLTSYGQVSYRFGQTRPFFRYDYQNVVTGDPIFGGLGRHNGPSIGVAQRLTNYVLFKIQFARLAESQNIATNAVQGQLAFAF